MRLDIVLKGKGLAGTSDLTLVANIRSGFVPALESVTYKSRLKRLLKALHLGRASAHEYQLVRPLSDAVERIGRIHSVRVVVLEAEDKLLLCATFDGSWESYFRTLWQKTGRLLDAIYCNTEGYVTAWDHAYDEWLVWARRVQRETDFYYGVPGITVDDQRQSRDTERRARRHPAEKAEIGALRWVSPSVETLAMQSVSPGTEDPFGDGLRSGTTGWPQRELVKQSLQSLGGLYALTDLYLPGTSDGPYLQRAAVEYLSELSDDYRNELNDDIVLRRFERQVRWLEQARAEPLPAVRIKPELPMNEPVFERSDVQGGIVTSYGDSITHGCILLLAFDTPTAASAFLLRLLNPVDRLITTAADQVGAVKRNIALTFEGLRFCGLSEHELAQFPDEFRQGMAARAGQIGDVRTNHPRRWRRPKRLGARPADMDDRIDLAAVHALINVRISAPSTGPAPDSDFDATLAGHPLHGELALLVPAGCGTRILAIESMRRNFVAGQIIEHFGYADGHSDPTIDPKAPDSRVSQVHLGELLQGYDNEADRAPEKPGRAWIFNGSFLVVRKLRQFVDRLEAAVGTVSPALDKELVYGKLVGRKRDGTPMLDGTTAANNDFTFAADPDGQQCPLHAHIRRANPRAMGSLGEPMGQRRPRIARRGMSYGRPYDSGDPHALVNKEERGVVFMAYNASIGEQFEVIQRWLSGGNSTGSTSTQSDALLGVPENGRRRFHRFEHGGKVHHLELDGNDCLYEEAQPLVQLEWGHYAFAPSITALRQLAERAALQGAPVPVWDEHEGERTVRRLLALSQHDALAAVRAWKVVLEDIESVRTFAAAGVWSAIRHRHGGLLRTPYGILVAEASLVKHVLSDGGRYSVCGYLERMQQSIGADHLGLDDTGPGCPYRRESKAVNDAILALPEDEAFESARGAARTKLSSIADDAKKKSLEFQDARYETSFDLREVIEEVLADLCEAWFGLHEHQDDARTFFVRGGPRWDWTVDQPPLYPGHFSASSRFIFQPQPGPVVSQYGVLHGKAVHAAALRFVRGLRQRRLKLTAKVGAAALEVAELPVGATPADRAQAEDIAARALVGAVMGMVPTMDGALRRVLSEWTGDGSLWSLRATRATLGPFADRQQASDALLGPMTRTLQLRPMPEMVWRTVTESHSLRGGDGRVLELVRGDVLVVSQVSVLQQALVDGGNDMHPMFGGDRLTRPHPTHACPGSRAGVAAMLGALAAFIEHSGGMRPGAASPTLMLEGETGVRWSEPLCISTTPATAGSSTPPSAVTAATETMTDSSNESAGSPNQNTAADRSAAPEQTPRLLLGWGDSWLINNTYGIGRPSNLMNSLLKHGFAAAQPSPFAESGKMLATMASIPADNTVYALFEDLVARGESPHAVMLSVSGNDCVKNALLTYVRAAGGATTIDRPLWEDHLELLYSYFAKVVGNFNRIGKKYGKVVPVVVHGYDHPVADGRFLIPAPVTLNAWIYGWLVTKLNYDIPQATGIMKDLIDDLNTMMIKLESDSSLGNVKHVNLAGTLRAKFGAGLSDEQWLAAPSPYKKAWENELHPTPAGFDALAERLAVALNAL